MKNKFYFGKRMFAVALSFLLCSFGSAYAESERTPDISSSSPQQSGKTVTCIVSDELGPVAGVNVVVKGTQMATLPTLTGGLH